MVCTTSGAVCGGYKRMLGRKKRHTEPAGKKEWSDGGQAAPSCLNRQIRPVNPPGHLYGLAHTREKTSLPLCGVERSFLYIGRTAPQASVNTLAMIFQPSRPFFRAWKSTQTVLTAEKMSCLQQSAGICARCTDSGADFCECKQRLRAVHAAPRGCAFPGSAV